MKRLIASTTPLALALTLLTATASRGQGQPGNPEQQGQSGRQSGQTANSQGQGASQEGQPGITQHKGHPQSAQSSGNHQGQAGKANNAQTQGGNASGQPRNPLPLNPQNVHSVPLFLGADHRSAANPELDAVLSRLGRRPNGQVFAVWLDQASRNSGMSLAPADAALRAQLKLPENQGLIVTQVEPGSPAAAVGIRQNDVLVRLEENSGPSHSVTLGKPEDLETALKDHGEQVIDLVLLRAGRPATLKVQPRVHAGLGPVLGPSRPHSGSESRWRAVEQALRSQLQLPENQGLIVMDVDRSGPAARAGLRKFDIILTFDGAAPADQAALTKLVQSHGGKTVSMQVLREAKPLEVSLSPERRHRFAGRISVDGGPRPSVNFIECLVPYTVRVPDIGTFADANGNLIGQLYQRRRACTCSKSGMSGDPCPTKRLDDLTAQIKQLRQAIEAMNKRSPGGTSDLAKARAHP